MSTQGVRDFDSYQEKSLVTGRFKFEKAVRYFVGFRASSGHYFNWSYSSFSGASSAVTIPEILRKMPAPLLGEFFATLRNGGGSPIPNSCGASFYMRELLYLSASPVKQVTLEFGGLGIEHGAASGNNYLR